MSTTGTEANAPGRIDIYRHNNEAKDRTMVFSDQLAFASAESKINAWIVAWNAQHEQEATVTYGLRAADAKLLCFDILYGYFTEWTSQDGVRTGDEKIVRTLTIRKDPKYKQPFVVKIDCHETVWASTNEWVKGACRDSLTILLSEREMRRAALALLDYIRDFEVVNFKKRREAMMASGPQKEEG